MNIQIEKFYTKILNNMHSVVIRKMDGGEMLRKEIEKHSKKLKI